MKEKANSWQKLPRSSFPPLLGETTDPPEYLYIEGSWPSKTQYFLTVVGARHHTSYGARACRDLILGLSGYPIAIVSGLAWGIDTIAHKSALEAGLITISVPGSGLDRSVLYPRENVLLAERILKEGGVLLSEYEPLTVAAPWTFPKRNRIMAGLSQATLIIEARSKSGTLITARLAMEYNRDVLAVPGPIDSLTSQGPNQLIADGARPALSSKDILESLGISLEKETLAKTLENFSGKEKLIIEALVEPRTKDEISLITNLPIREVLITISDLELRGLVKETGGKLFRIF